MSDRSLLIAILVMVSVEMALIIEGFKDVNGRDEYLAIVAFLAGAGAAWAIIRGGGNK